MLQGGSITVILTDDLDIVLILLPCPLNSVDQTPFPPEQGYRHVPDPSLARIHSPLQTPMAELVPLHR
jgi:hypothetical protein